MKPNHTRTKMAHHCTGPLYHLLPVGHRSHKTFSLSDFTFPICLGTSLGAPKVDVHLRILVFQPSFLGAITWLLARSNTRESEASMSPPILWCHWNRYTALIHFHSLYDVLLTEKTTERGATDLPCGSRKSCYQPVHYASQMGLTVACITYKLSHYSARKVISSPFLKQENYRVEWFTTIKPINKILKYSVCLFLYILWTSLDVLRYRGWGLKRKTSWDGGTQLISPCVMVSF